MQYKIEVAMVIVMTEMKTSINIMPTVGMMIETAIELEVMIAIVP